MDLDKLLGTLNEEEMCQIKIVSPDTAEFGQNLDFKCQLFFSLEPNFTGICERKPQPPSLSETGVSGISSLPSQSTGDYRREQ